MDLIQFRMHSENILNYIIHYLKTISERNLNTDVHQKNLKSLMPETAPNKGEPLESIMHDLEKYIIPSLEHLQNPGFHAFGQSSSAYPSILSEMLSVTFGCVGFNWHICPSIKDLESSVLDWYGRMIGLPEVFLHRTSNGGCIIQGTTNESIVTCIITARQNFLKQLSRKRFSISKPFMLTSLVAYCTQEARHNFQEAVIIAMVNLRILDTDGNFCLQANTLVKAIEADKAIGFIPFFVNISLGNVIGTSDSLDEIGIVCEEYNLWMNVDASYAGNALICPEYRHYTDGIEYVTSFIINPCEWLMMHHNCVFLFVTDLAKISDSVMADTTMFNYGFSENDWSFDDKKTFAAFNLWVNIRSYGTGGLEKHIQNHFELAELFKKYMTKNEHFSVLNCNFGKVYFRLKGSNTINETFFKGINASGNLLLNYIILEKIFIICFTVYSEGADEDYIKTAWNAINELADEMFETEQNN